MTSRLKTWILTISLSVVFGILMTFWGLGKESSDKLMSFLLYAGLFGILHRTLVAKNRR